QRYDHAHAGYVTRPHPTGSIEVVPRHTWFDPRHTRRGTYPPMARPTRGRVVARLATASAILSGMAVAACTGTMSDGGEGGAVDSGGTPAGDAGRSGDAGPSPGDAGAPDGGAASSDAGGGVDAGPDGVGVFVLQGHAGR